MSTNLPRVHQKIFGETAMSLEPAAIAQFGSVIAGTPNRTGDIEEIQALQNWEQGWVGSTITNRRYPTSEETTGINKVITQQLAYILQKGMPEWCEDTTYFQTSFCQYQGTIYHSLTDNNTNHLPTDTTYWEIYPAPDSLPLDTSMSNIAPLGIDRMNQSKALITGNIASYNEELSQLKDMAHSTFDSSKFTVVGSPTITDNGIASGFNASNYITFATFDTTKPWKIKTKITTGAISTNEQGLFSSTSWLWLRIAPSSINNPFSFLIYLNGVEQRVNGTQTVQPNTEYTIEFAWTGTQYYLKAYLADGTLFDTLSYNSTANAELKTIDTQISIFGNFIANTAHYFEGSTDLKEFSLTVDGIVILSGNKTGIDTVKVDNYTIIGSPTITSDGVVSEFSNANYIQTPNLNYSQTVTDCELIIPFKITSDASTTQFVMCQRTPDVDYGFKLQLLLTGTSRFLFSTDGSTWGNTFTIPSDTFSLNVAYLFKAKLKDSSFSISYSSNNGATWTSLGAQTVSQLYMGSVFDIGASSGANPVVGSINLNAFKIYVDGDLIYQPCLKIPYTESKTGSKIVDSIYRDRISDMYSQFGYAPYYTLSDSDFTLPQGEIYGMMLNQSTPHIVKTYINDTSWYNLYSNGWCEQGGYVSGISGDTGTSAVTLVVDYADTNYSVLITQEHASTGNGGFGIKTGKTTSGFTLWWSATNATGFYWRTEGQI